MTQTKDKSNSAQGPPIGGHLKAIPTTYKGVEMRSKLEARWARFFDDAGQPWQYEPQGYDLDGLWYLPDFFLPESRAFFEVKGVMDSASAAKIKRFAKAAALDGFNVFVGVDIEGPLRGMQRYKGEVWVAGWRMYPTCPEFYDSGDGRGWDPGFANPGWGGAVDWGGVALTNPDYLVSCYHCGALTQMESWGLWVCTVCGEHSKGHDWLLKSTASAHTEGAHD